MTAYPSRTFLPWRNETSCSRRILNFFIYKVPERFSKKGKMTRGAPDWRHDPSGHPLLNNPFASLAATRLGLQNS